MSIKRLQELLNEKLGKNTVDLTPYLKNREEPTRIPLGNPARLVRINGIAADLTVRMDTGKYEKMDKKTLAEAAAANNWHDYLSMPDEELCIKGYDQEDLYQNLKANGMLGEDEEEARTIRMITKMRLDLMTNPYYDLLDPKALDKVPTKILEEIYLQLKIEGAAPDPEEGIAPTYLADYLLAVAERNANREALMHKEIDRNLATDAAAQADTVATFMDQPDTPETRQEINAGIRALIGGVLAQKAAQDAVIPYSDENAYKYSSAEYRDSFTKHITDEDIENARKELGDDFFKNLAANIPENEALLSADSPALSQLVQTAEKHAKTREENHAANAWFNDLALSLNKENIDLFDVNAKNWFKIQPAADKEKAAAEKAAEKAAVNIGNVSPLTAPQETKTLLFRMAKENRLTLEHPVYEDLPLHVGAENKAVFDKPVRAAMSLEDRHKRAWFEDLKAQLAARGIKTPESMMQLCVRSAVDPDQPKMAKPTFEKAVATGQHVFELSTPALMPHKEDGSLVDPIAIGDDALDWIFMNMPASLDDVEQDKINELYKLAGEHRLYLRSTDTTLGGSEKNMYILADPDHKARIMRPMIVLEQEMKKNPEQKDFDGLTREQFAELSKHDQAVAQAELAAKVFMSRVENVGTSDLGQNDTSPYSENQKEIFHESLKIYSNVTSIGPVAQLHNDWFENHKLARLYVKANYAGMLNPRNRDEEQAELVHDYPINSQGFRVLEKRLLELTGCKTIPEVMASGLVSFDKGHEPIDTTDSLEYSADILRRMRDGEDLIVNGKAYNFPTADAMEEGINKEAYQEQLEFLISRTDRVSGGSARNSAFDRFEEHLRALPARIQALNKSRYAGFEETRKLMKEALDEGKRYIEDHKNSKLNTKQLERIKIINRFKDMVKDLEDRNCNTGRNYEYRIAEKLMNAALIKMKKTKHLLKDASRRKLIKATMNDPVFKKRMEKLTDEQKLALVKTSDKNLAKALRVNMIFNKPEAPQGGRQVDHRDGSAVQNGPQNRPHGPRMN